MFFDGPLPPDVENFSLHFSRLPIPQDRRIAHVARALDVCERSVRDWATGRRPAPRAACFFLWTYSPDCINLINERAHREAAEYGRLYIGAKRRANELESTVAALQRELAEAKKKAAPSRFTASNATAFGGPQPPSAAPLWLQLA